MMAALGATDFEQDSGLAQVGDGDGLNHSWRNDLGVSEKCVQVLVAPRSPQFFNLFEYEKFDSDAFCRLTTPQRLGPNLMPSLSSMWWHR
jgi:hypothetical protein